MRNNNIVIDSDKIDAIIGEIDSSSISISDGAQKSKRDFSCLQGSKDLSEGVNVISDSLSFFSDKINGYKKLISQHGTAFFEQETILSSGVDDIQVPSELSVVDNIFKVDIDSINLSKTDGKAINTNDISSVMEYDDSKEIIRENLELINNKPIEEVRFDEESSIYKSEINNINNNNETEVQEMKDEYDIDKEKVSNINSYKQEEMLYNPYFTYNVKKSEEDGDKNDIES